jgi:hypothetical protein
LECEQVLEMRRTNAVLASVMMAQIKTDLLHPV